MKSLKLWLLACAVSLAMGCGGTPTDMASEGKEMSVSSQELTGCTATCALGTVSCPSSTQTCSATNNVGVTCDGVAIACPPTGCTQWMMSCAVMQTLLCSEAETIPCCRDDSEIGECICTEFGRRPPVLLILPGQMNRALAPRVDEA